MNSNGSRNQVGQQMRMEYFIFVFKDTGAEIMFDRLDSYEKTLKSFEFLSINPQKILAVYLKLKTEKRVRLVWLRIGGFLLRAFTYFILKKHYFQKKKEQELFTNKDKNARSGSELSSLFLTLGVYILPEWVIRLLTSNIRFAIIL